MPLTLAPLLTTSFVFNQTLYVRRWLGPFEGLSFPGYLLCIQVYMLYISVSSFFFSLVNCINVWVSLSLRIYKCRRKVYFPPTWLSKIKDLGRLGKTSWGLVHFRNCLTITGVKQFKCLRNASFSSGGHISYSGNYERIHLLLLVIKVHVGYKRLMWLLQSQKPNIDLQCNINLRFSNLLPSCVYIHWTRFYILIYGF